MKFFVINLEKDIKRREKIENLCHKLNIEFEIVSAVYGKNLTKEELNKLVASEEEQLKHIKRPLSLGEIGCVLSHKKCYERIVEDNLDYAVIIEDDAIFDSKVVEFLKHIEEFPKDLELLLLGHHRQVYLDDGFTINSPYSLRYKMQIQDHTIRRLVGRGNGTHGYLISKNGAIKLLDKMKKVYMASDLYTSNDNIVNVYAVFPTIINFEIANESSTQANFKIKKRPLIAKYFKLLRCKVMFFIPSIKRLKKYK